MSMYYSRAEYESAIRFIAANNYYCRDQEHAREVLDRALRSCAALPLSRENPVTQAGSLGLAVIRINGSDRLSIYVNPAIELQTYRIQLGDARDESVDLDSAEVRK